MEAERLRKLPKGTQDVVKPGTALRHSSTEFMFSTIFPERGKSVFRSLMETLKGKFLCCSPRYMTGS